ncbi:uncharacterized protein LOC62_03G004322 [Vanrija pseudolonga]|uniref:Uncharacterized protein n=1 Tax=Vanrija pseudolonga TaxID=143232 RepID=A0AAF0Y7G0_9TREE|nr:hypothetical protein LOC62_03G004322 [Vanrija pseudolonga]
MLLFNLNDYEIMVALPTTYDKALALAIEKYTIPKDHVVRLGCRASELAYIGNWATTEYLWIADNDSFYYACAGKHVTRLDVIVTPRNVSAPEKKDEAKADGGAKGGGGGGGGGKGSAPFSATTTAANSTKVEIKGNVTASDLSKGPAPNKYVGTLTVEPNTFAYKFDGQALKPDVVHDKATARILFKPSSTTPRIELLPPNSDSMEVTVTLKGWEALTTYPRAKKVTEAGKTRLRWFGRVGKGGMIEDSLDGTHAQGVFYEILSKPANAGPEDPLVPAWPDIRPVNSWCLGQATFVAHIDRVLTTLGVPIENRTAIITSWLPSITRHSNIAYRILDKEQIAASSELSIVPPAQAVLRFFILFKGIPDSELGKWAGRGAAQVERGADWVDALGANALFGDEKLFRVIEYAAMEVHD